MGPNKWWLVMVLLFSPVASAQMVEVRDLSLIWKKYDAGSRHPMMQLSGLENNEVDQGLDLDWNVDFWEHRFYFDNTIASLVDKPIEDSGPKGQFRIVGWNAKLGYRLWEHVWLEREHTSIHILDHKSPQRFPAVDSWNIQIRFMGD